jgi:hypothetical protein
VRHRLRSHGDAIEREAARLLLELIRHLHVAAERTDCVQIEADLPSAAFDRLCVWGAAVEDCEDEEDATNEDGEAHAI